MTPLAKRFMPSKDRLLKNAYDMMHTHKTHGSRNIGRVFICTYANNIINYNSETAGL